MLNDVDPSEVDRAVRMILRLVALSTLCMVLLTTWALYIAVRGC